MAMPTLLEHLAARLAYHHARHVYGRFLRTLADVSAAQQHALERALRLLQGSAFARRYGLHAVRSPSDLKHAVPLLTFEDYRPYIDRLCAGESGALFGAGQPIRMFATSSGTTAEPKRIPVTDAFIEDYRRGWNTFGLKMLTDHPRAILRPILQSSGRYDAERTSAGIPCGAITGLLAQTQKRIVRRFYVGRPEVAHLDDPLARYYTLMRLGIGRDVAFAITANPATLIEMARAVDEHSESLIRDVRDCTLAAQIVTDPGLRRTLTAGLRPDPQRAAELDGLRRAHGALRPRDYWRLEFLACWTGGSMGHYLDRLAGWWGNLPVRDVGLLASEGRVSMPLDDNTPIGVLDVTAAVFEFIPMSDAEAPHPATLGPRDLQPGQDYLVVLTNTTGLTRYRLDDVVRVHGFLTDAPLIEFLHRAGRVSSIVGEKLTEHQAVAAVQTACRQAGLPEIDFVLAPCWGDPPFYRLNCPTSIDPRLPSGIDSALCHQNEEYASRRKSNRLGTLQLRLVPPNALSAMDRRHSASRRTPTEQYKRPCLLTQFGEDDQQLMPHQS